jgi:chromosome partitioning protein
LIVGKTTPTINLGAALAEYGRRVLLVDFDPQGPLWVGLGVNPHNLDLSVYNLLMDPGGTIDDVVAAVFEIPFQASRHGVFDFDG